MLQLWEPQQLSIPNSCLRLLAHCQWQHSRSSVEPGHFYPIQDPSNGQSSFWGSPLVWLGLSQATLLSEALSTQPSFLPPLLSQCQISIVIWRQMTTRLLLFIKLGSSVNHGESISADAFSLGTHIKWLCLLRVHIACFLRASLILGPSVHFFIRFWNLLYYYY